MAKNLLAHLYQITCLQPNMDCLLRGEMYCYWHGAIDIHQKKEAIKDHWRDL